MRKYGENFKNNQAVWVIDDNPPNVFLGQIKSHSKKGWFEIPGDPYRTFYPEEMMFSEEKLVRKVFRELVKQMNHI